MTRYGYFLSCEEYGPNDLIRQAKLAEEAASTPCGSLTTTIPGSTSRGRPATCGR